MAVGSRLEHPDHAGRDADRVERLDLDDELETSGAGQHDVDLLRVFVLAREALTLAGVETVQAEAGARSLEIVVCEARLLDAAEPQAGRGVFDIRPGGYSAAEPEPLS